MAIRLDQSGMTLVEILVSLFIMGMVATGGYNLFNVHNRIAAEQEETTLMQQELLTSMVQMTDDMRMCGYAPTSGTFGFRNLPSVGDPNYGRATNGTSVYCTWDADEDGVVDDNATENEHVAYRLNVNDDGSARATADNVLRKYMDGQWQPVATNIGALNFAYLDEDGAAVLNPSANLGSIHVVRIQAVAVPSPLRAGLGIGNRTMATSVLCRNLGK